MAIAFSDLHEGVRASWNLQSGKSFTVEVLAECDELTGPNAVMTATGLTLGSSYRWPIADEAPVESSPYHYLNSMSIEPYGDDSRAYKLSITFSPVDPSREGQDPEEGYDPFAVPPTFRAYSEDEDFYPLVDEAGVPIRNSAGDYMSDVSVKVRVPTYEIGVVVPTFPRAAVKDVKGHLNDAEWQGFAAGTLLCADINTNRVWDEKAQINKWEVTYVFQYKEPVLKTYSAQSVEVVPGWSLIVLDAGLRQKVGGKMVPILSEGVPTSEPLPLKADGTAVGPTDSLHFLTFDVIPRADFSVLPVPPGIFG